MADERPTIFVGYSHLDEVWKDRLLPHLRQLEKAGLVAEVWDDRRIKVGADWYAEIQRVLARTRYAIVLVTAGFLASDFCQDEEVPYLLQRRRKGGLELLPILVKPCQWGAFRWLRRLQMLPRDGQSVENHPGVSPDGVFDAVAGQLVAWIGAGHVPAVPRPPVGPPAERVDFDRLPETGSLLFGRRDEMRLLDEAWDDPRTTMVVFRAWGGVGKSTLVRAWCEELREDGFRGAERVFAWSFYSQGTSDRVTSADLFVAKALEGFGDPDPTAGSPWAKGERLAALVRSARTLLLLDGLEPLQEGPGPERGRVRDPALGTLLRELARENPGLCVVTTREPVLDLAEPAFAGRVEVCDLEQVSRTAGRALLRVRGVRDPDDALEAAVAAFGRQALALNLLGSYVRETPGRTLAAAGEIPALDDVPEDQGRPARRVIAAHAARLGDGPERAALRLLGLFDRPAEAAELAALRAGDALPGLTGPLAGAAAAVWTAAVERLRTLGLVARESHHRPGALDAHPLVREHFATELRRAHPDAWREGHRRLYEHLKAAAPERPDTLAELAPLYAAVRHGCAAGLHQAALYDVFWQRIRRGAEHFSAKKLGAFAADLAALAHFFEAPWRRPAPAFATADASWILNEAGFALRALGRLADAVAPLEAGLAADVVLEDRRNASVAAGTLSELLLALGRLAEAEVRAREAVANADRSGDAFQCLGLRTTVADALHHQGRLAEARALFAEAERMQADWQPEFPLLYSVQGFRYGDLLLTLGEPAEAFRRAEQTLPWAVRHGALLGIALDRLTLGRARLALALRDLRPDFAPAAAALDTAVDGLRAAGTQHHLPRGLLARAALARHAGDLARAQRDVAEARTLCERCGLRLHLVDVDLEQARLDLAAGARDAACAGLAIARAAVAEMGYHRRDPEVAALEAACGAP